MLRSRYGAAMAALLLAGCVGGLSAVPAAAQSVMQQCGQQYQAAKAANTLNGMTWNQYRTECAARLKATPASAAAPAAAPAATPPAAAAAAPATPAANPLKPAAATPTPAAAPMKPAAATPTPAAAAPAATTAAAPATEGKPMSPGRAAFVARERQCGSEWKANKVSLVAATPGLTWPKYLSQCNTRLKAAGQ